MQFNEETVDDARLARISGPLSRESVDTLRSALHRLAESGARNVVLDLQGVSFVGSAALGALVSFRQTIVSAGGKVALCGLGTAVHKLFKVSHLDDLFEIATSEPAALAAVRQAGP